jgi:hypothetical protein
MTVGPPSTLLFSFPRLRIKLKGRLDTVEVIEAESQAELNTLRDAFKK